MKKRTKVCIDRVPPRDLKRFQPTTRGPSNRVRAIAIGGKTWMNGTTLGVKFIGGTKAQKALVREEAGWWENVANIHFDFSGSPSAEIRIAFDPDDGAWSYIGTDCKGIGAEHPTMNLGFLDSGTVAHEFGHAIGLAHEHQNPKGGIKWNEEVVLRELAGPPNEWDEDTIRHNVLRKYSADQVKGTEFDPDSIMLYFFPASWTLNGVATKANSTLSRMDKDFISGARMYPKSGPTPSSAAVLKIGAPKRTKASIGKAGEEDLYQFKVNTDGRYVVDTQGETDVVMKLFGPNAETALIAEDDDSGTDTNARIASNLIAGLYFVQVRHYDKLKANGNYSIQVRKL